MELSNEANDTMLKHILLYSITSNISPNIPMSTFKPKVTIKQAIQINNVRLNEKNKLTNMMNFVR